MRIPFVSLALLGALAGCGGSQGKLMADTMQFDAKQQKWQPLIAYSTPDISEITGIEEPDESEAPAATAPASETKPAPAPAPAQTPAPAPAKPAGK